MTLTLSLRNSLQAAVGTRQMVATPLARDAVLQADAALVTRHLAGDPRAFGELVKRYTAAVYNVAFRFTGDPQEAENISQETFLRIWHAMPRVALDRPLKPYLLKVTLNLCRDWADRNKVAQVDSLDRDEMEPAGEGDPLEAVSIGELRARVRAGIETLPPLYRTVLTLRYSEELSYEEMATALDIPVNTVRTHLHRAKARLREVLEPVWRT